ncbi:hypothetical protein BT69DRAFT_1338981 [Atractiella rhizophila]|nr:hypothetical protein BT69DRAFT_1338981 [Atractiella rhizophila]
MSYADAASKNTGGDHGVQPDPVFLDDKDTDALRRKAQDLKAEGKAELDAAEAKAEKERKEFLKREKELEKKARAEYEKGKAKAKEYGREGRDEFNRHPAVYTTALSALNVAIVGGVAYWSYQNWDRTWDRKLVTASAIGLGAWFSLQGWLVEKLGIEQRQ